MDIKEINNLNIGNVYFDVDLSKYTTYKLKGIARVLAIPNDLECLQRLLNYIKEKKTIVSVFQII